MGMTGLLHATHLTGSLPAYLAFLRALKHPEEAQRTRLAAVLGHLSSTDRWGDCSSRCTYEKFQEKAQPCFYSDLEPDLSQQRHSGSPRISPTCTRWQPTSGSTSPRKWIPYPPAFLSELNVAAGAWMVDLARRFPGAFRGRHYWSLSWLPTELRQGGMASDDLTLLPAWKRLGLGKVMAAPSSVGILPTNEDAMVAIATWLAARTDLSLISVWSPTFGLALLRTLSEQRESIAKTLEHGLWAFSIPAPRNRRVAAMLRQWDGDLASAFFRELWPGLRLLSAWDAAGSQTHAANLAAKLPQASLQGKGLWATEGVVTIPFQDLLPLALTSHFLEFRCLSTDRIFPAWKLELEQELQPLLTTSSGLVRYALEDRVKMTGFLQRTPCLTFLGRLGGTDMVGEKLDAQAVAGLFRPLADNHGIRCITLFAVEGDSPHYCLLAEGEAASSVALQTGLEDALCAFHHYRLARELRQLAPAEVLIVRDSSAILTKRANLCGFISGEMKVQPLDTWKVNVFANPGSGP